MPRITLVVRLGAIAALLTDAGCNSTSSNQGAPDAAANAPDAAANASDDGGVDGSLDAHPQSDAGADASGPTACASAGGQCIADDATCWGMELSGGCGDGGGACCMVVFDAGSCTEADAQTVDAASYNQACEVDKELAAISEGNSCDPCDFSCVNATINAGDLAKYTSDTSGFPAVLAVSRGACASSCGGPVSLCCLGGKCHMGSPCPFNVLGGVDAAADTGADAAMDGGAADAAGE